MDYLEKIKSVQQIHNLIDKYTHVEEMLDSTSKQLKQIWPGEQVYFLLFNKDRKLVIVNVDGINGSVSSGFEVEIGEGAIGLAALLRQPFYISNTSMDTKSILINSTTSSQLAIPLLNSSRIEGVMVLENSSTDAYDEIDQNLLGIIANYISLKLSQIYQEEKKQIIQKYAELITRLSKQIHSTNNLPSILKISASEIALTTNASKVEIRIFDTPQAMES